MDVRTVCLGILTLGDATGYEIKKMFEDNGFAQVFDASYGSIYPALTRLTRDGHVSCRVAVQEGRPDRKVYSLTESGRATFLEELVKPPATDRVRSEFMLSIVFSGLMEPAQVDEILDRRLAEHEAAIEELEAEMAGKHGPDGAPLSPQWRFVIGYGIRFHQGAADYIRRNRHLVTGTPAQSAEHAPFSAPPATRAGAGR